MDMQQVTKDVKLLISQVAAVPVSDIALSENFEGDLNIDGVEKTKILNTLAKKYETEFNEIDIHKINTVQQLIDIVADNLGII